MMALLPRIFQWLFVMSCFICLGVKAIDQNIASAKDFNEDSGLKRAAPYDAFNNDINKCLFTAWTRASGNPRAVLSAAVPCKGYGGTAKQLCYGLDETRPAQFAVCYNTNTLTPDFTGHLVNGTEGNGRETEWRADKGKYAPKPQSTIDDYDPYKQKGLYDNWDPQKQFFCAKGHLTPNADFGADNERALTMITTNVAPQWQNFNSQNWAGLEAAIRRYARTNMYRKVYVFTGVGGQARNLQGVVIKLNKKVLAPRWYWKAVCDPVARQSIVFVGENPIGIAAVNRVAGCNNLQQTRTFGVVYCYSLERARQKYKEFKLPPFDVKNCNPSEEGTFMDNELRTAFG